MFQRQTGFVITLLVLICLLAIAGGLVTAFATSPQSFNFGPRQPTLFTEAPTSEPTGTPSPTAPLMTATATKKPFQPPIYLPTDTSVPAGQPTVATLQPTASATATAIVLPPDVRALARVSDSVGSTLVRVRDQPNGTVVVATLSAGTPVQVLFGSSLVDGVAWLQVRLANRQVGWVAGYLLTIILERPADSGTLTAPLATDTLAAPQASATTAPNNNPPPGPSAAPPATPAGPGPTSAPTDAAPTDTPPPAIDTNTPQPTATSAPASATLPNRPPPQPTRTPRP